MFKFFILTFGLFIISPSVFAATKPTDFRTLVDLFINIINLLIPLIAGLSVLVFFWGLAQFIFRVAGDEKEIENGKNLMFYGILGLFVMFSVWAILSLLVSDFGFTFGIPQLPI